MENNKNKEDTRNELQNTLITIVSVLVYIVYSLAKRFVGFIKYLCKNGIFTIISAVIVIVLAIMFWPITLAIVATALIFIFCQVGFDMFK